MKKILLFFVVLVSALSARSQTVYMGGTAGIGYSDESFQLHLLPSVGYEFNEKFAVGMGVGYEYIYEESAAIINPYLRFTPWHNDNLSFDLKAQAWIFCGSFETSTLMGITPSFRYKLSEKWEIATDLGTLGVMIVEGESYASVVVKNVNVNASIMYRF